MFYIITLPYACFGIVVKDSVVIKTPPIARWMVGKSVVEVKKWVATKRGDILYSNIK